MAFDIKAAKERHNNRKPKTVKTESGNNFGPFKTSVYVRPKNGSESLQIHHENMPKNTHGFPTFIPIEVAFAILENLDHFKAAIADLDSTAEDDTKMEAIVEKQLEAEEQREANREAAAATRLSNAKDYVRKHTKRRGKKSKSEAEDVAAEYADD